MTVVKILCLIGDLVFFVWLAVSIRNVNVQSAVDVSISATDPTSADAAANRTAHRLDDKLILVFGLLFWLLRIGTMCASIFLEYKGFETIRLRVCIAVYITGSIGWLVCLIVTFRSHYVRFCVIGVIGYGFMMFWCLFTAVISCVVPNIPVPKMPFHFGRRAKSPISTPPLGLRRRPTLLRPRVTFSTLPDGAFLGHPADAPQAMMVDLSSSHPSLKQKASDVKKLDKATLSEQNLNLVREKEQLICDNARIIAEKAAAEQRSIELSVQVNDLRSRIAVLEMPAEVRTLECPICCEPYSEKHLSAFVPCGHTMCAVCALQIFDSPTTCSLCRKPITAVQTIHFNSL